jgi:hypothetical protein
LPPNLQYYGTSVTLAPTTSAAVGMRAAAVVANANGAAPPHHHVYPIPATTIQQGGTLQVSLHIGMCRLRHVNCLLQMWTAVFTHGPDGDLLK